MRYFIFFLICATFVLMWGSCTLNKRVAYAYKKYSARAPYDVIIVPGFPYSDTTPKWPLLSSRIYWAKELYDKGMARNIIFSGGAIHTPYIEGRIMKIIADSLGIPPQHTFSEEQAPHSYQNVMYSYKMAHKLGFKKIAVATDPYQFSYMASFVWYAAPGTGILSFSPDSMRKYIRPLPAFNTRDAFVKDFIPLEDR